MDIVDVVHLKEQYTLKLEPCRTTDPTSDHTVQVFSPESREGDCISKQSQDVHSYFGDSFSSYGEKGTTVFDSAFRTMQHWWTAQRPLLSLYRNTSRSNHNTSFIYQQEIAQPAT